MKTIRGGFRVDSYRRDFTIDRRPYAGLEVGHPWPIALSKIEKLEATYDDEWDVVADSDFVNEYCVRIGSSWSPLRVLIIENDECNIEISVPASGEFIGYDVCVSGGAYSILGQDVFTDRVSERNRRFRSLANQWGLLDSRSDAELLLGYAKQYREDFDVLEGGTIAGVFWLRPSYENHLVISATDAYEGVVEIR